MENSGRLFEVRGWELWSLLLRHRAYESSGSVRGVWARSVIVQGGGMSMMCELGWALESWWGSGSGLGSGPARVMP